MVILHHFRNPSGSRLPGGLANPDPLAFPGGSPSWGFSVGRAVRLVYLIFTVAVAAVTITGYWPWLTQLPVPVAVIAWLMVALLLGSAALILFTNDVRGWGNLLPALTGLLLIGLMLCPRNDAVGISWWPSSAIMELQVFGLVGGGRVTRWVWPVSLGIASAVGMAIHAPARSVAASAVFADALSAGAFLGTAGLLYFGLAISAQEADTTTQARLRLRSGDESALRDALDQERAEQFIHDVVIHALRAVAQFGNGVDRENVVEHSRSAADAIEAGGASPQFNRLRDDLRDAARAYQLDVSIAGHASAPSYVLQAVGVAATEALRNVARHSGTKHADIKLQQVGTGLRALIEDRGVGIDARRAPGHRGISESIVGQMERAGGTARVLSQPGIGTSVILEWEPASRMSATRELARLSQRTDRIFMCLPLAPLSTGLVETVARMVQGHDALPFVGIVGVLALILLLALSPDRPRLSAWQAAVLWLAVTAVATLAALTLDPADAAGFNAVASTTAALQVVILFRPPREFLVYVPATLLITWSALVAHVGVAATVAVYSSAIVAQVLALSVGFVMRSVLWRMRRGRAETDEQLSDPMQQRAQDRIVSVDRSLSRLADVGGFLRQIAETDLDPAQADVQARARVHESALRDALTFHEPLPGVLASALAAARFVGWRVHLHADLELLREQATTLAAVITRVPAARVGQITISERRGVLTLLIEPAPTGVAWEDRRWRVSDLGEVTMIVIPRAGLDANRARRAVDTS